MRTLRSLLVLQPHRIAIVARPRGSDWLSDDIQNRSQKVVEVLVPLLTPEDYSPRTSAALASKSGSSNMPGLEALKDNCNDSAETCWRRFLKEHGRKFVSSVWDAHSLLPLGVVPTCGNGIGTLFANSIGLNCSPDVILLVLGHDLG